MPDDRLFHKRLGHSAKIAALTDFEYIVWHAYVLSSDDFGVMRFSAITLQADHDRLASKPQKTVQRALERVRDVGLMVTYEHQGRLYCAQADWQNHQRVKFPRQTINPKPPENLLTTFTHATRQLFQEWPGKKPGRPTRQLPEIDESFSDHLPTDPHFARAPGREEANANANGKRLMALDSERGVGKTNDAVDAVQRLVDMHRELHARYRGVAYLGNPQKDYQAACELVAAFPDPSMQDALLTYGLNDGDVWMDKGPRTIARIKSQASKYAEELQRKALV